MTTTTVIEREMQRLREARFAPLGDVLNAAQAQMQAAVEVVGTGPRWIPGARSHLLQSAALLAVLADRTLDCPECGHHPCDCYPDEGATSDAHALAGGPSVTDLIRADRDGTADDWADEDTGAEGEDEGEGSAEG